ncbi:MAG: bifunctional UDP-N-acetylglucosamine diphosphorylase/glucosamine-1-phosphate N-acetyltransferase GlmU [Cyanobacteria bacterium P01_E01_bin.45]
MATQKRPIAVAILAAGKGTRMRSQLPKVLHKLGALTLVERTLITAQQLNPNRCYAIVGYAQDKVRETLQDYSVEFVEQLEQLGTGHAIQKLLPHLTGFQGDLLVLNADVPLLRPTTLKSLIEFHRSNQSAATLLTARVDDPTGYGRVLCNTQDQIDKIVEHRDCTPEQLEVNRINGGIYCFHWPELETVLPNLGSENSQQEYYLTDTVSMVSSAYAIDVSDDQELQGINDRYHLSLAYRTLQDRLKTDWMKAGVTFIDPQSCTIDDSVQLEPDCTIEPQTHLKGSTTIAAGCTIGPNSTINNSSIGPDSAVTYSVISDSAIGAHSRIGPFTHLRGNTQIGDRCRIGNFVEMKNAKVGNDTNAAHLSYIGDAALGEQVNIGAGTITANFDGQTKHFTHIGDRSKTGSNSVLVAPIELGSDVSVGAGSTITESVPDDSLVIARARQVVKSGWRPKATPPDTTK